MIRPQITAIEDGFATGSWGNLFIGICHGPATPAAIREWTRQHEHMALRHPGGFLSMVIIESLAPIPDASDRQALSGAIDRVSGTLRALGGVLEAHGFVGATFRSVMLTLFNMRRAPFPRRMFGSCDEAARWLAPQFQGTSGPVTATQIIDAVHEFRELVKPGSVRFARDARAPK